MGTNGKQDHDDGGGGMMTGAMMMMMVMRSIGGSLEALMLVSRGWVRLAIKSKILQGYPREEYMLMHTANEEGEKEGGRGGEDEEEEEHEEEDVDGSLVPRLANGS